MSSPLSWFRKNQKVMMGIFVVLLMFVFTLSMGSGIDPIIDYLSGGRFSSGRAPSDEVVVTWKDGTLRESDFVNLRESRTAFRQFLMACLQETMARGGRPYEMPSLNTSVAERDLLERVMLSQEANRLGLIVTNSDIVGFLERISGGTIQMSEFLKIWQGITGGTERQLLDLLRTELSAFKVIAMLQSGVAQTSPVQSWELYNRLSRKVKAEMLPFEVDSFVDEVKEPQDAQLVSFYEEYKNKYAEPGSPKPGFKRRQRMAFDAVRFDFEKFLEIESKNVTDEEIREYYEQNKEEYINTSLPSSDLEVDEQQPAASEAEAPSVEGEMTNEEQINVDAASENQSEVDNDEMSLEAAFGIGPKEVKDAAASEAAASEAAASEAAASNEADSTNNVDAADTTETEKKAADDGDAAGIESDHDADPSFSPIPQGETADEQTADDSDVDASGPRLSSAATESTSGEGSIKSGDAAAAEKKYQPLESVADEIRESLARRRAQRHMVEVIARVQGRAEAYYRKHAYWKIQLTKDKEAPEPDTPTWDDIQEAEPVAIESVPLSDEFELEMYPLGQSYEIRLVNSGVDRLPFSAIAFTDSLPMYQPRRFPQQETSPVYVYWKTAEEAAYEPDLAEVRDEVVYAWKLDQARKFAKKAAESAAKTAREKRSALSEALAAEGRTFIDTGAISWMTGGSVGLQAGGMPQLGVIPGVRNVTDEMMHTIFRLQPGEIGVVTDSTKTVYYVVRVNEYLPELENRQEGFLATGADLPGLGSLKMRDTSQYLMSWYQGLQNELDVAWQRDPAARVRQ